MMPTIEEILVYLELIRPNYRNFLMFLSSQLKSAKLNIPSSKNFLKSSFVQVALKAKILVLVTLVVPWWLRGQVISKNPSIWLALSHLAPKNVAKATLEFTLRLNITCLGS